MFIEDTTPIAALTVADLKKLLKDSLREQKIPGKRYVYGLKGIQDLFGVCHLTAQRYKDGFLAPACIQNGRKIIVDADMAIDLFKNYQYENAR